MTPLNMTPLNMTPLNMTPLNMTPLNVKAFLDKRFSSGCCNITRIGFIFTLLGYELNDASDLHTYFYWLSETTIIELRYYL